MNRKRFLLLLIALFMLAFVGCGGQTQDVVEEVASTAETAVEEAATEVAPTVEAVVEEAEEAVEEEMAEEEPTEEAMAEEEPAEEEMVEEAPAEEEMAEGEMGEPKQGGTLRVAFQNEWAGLDPQVVSSYSSYQVLFNVVETLTRYDDDLNLVPSLAESWEQSEDGLTWTFKLREGVMFHNGREMTAEDVKWSFERLIDPATGAGNAGNVGTADTQIEVIDDYTVAITHPEPVGILPQTLAFNPASGIIAQESLEDDGTISIPIGTGPFQIAEVEGTTRLVLERFDGYWQEGYPYLDQVVIEPIPDDTVRETALLGGEVDWVLTIAPQNYQSLVDNPDIVVDTAPQLSYDYIGMNLTRAPFDDVRVRQAIALAIDRDTLCQAGFFGLCETIQGPVGSGSPWDFNYEPYDRDVERAKELLAEAGYPDGFEMELLPTTQYGETVRAAQVLQQQLAEIGIVASINAPEWSEWLELEGNFMYDAYICNWNGLIDADQYYYLQHRNDQVFNFTGYNNPQFDELVDAGRAISDFDERYQIYEQADKVLVDDAPYIYMYNKEEIRAYQP
ncbi:MAG: ABC transporter substrate-binding protein, partial [Candidatus Promineifilaceae bacterium]|nr:ABC transporter substrate-binding protein [Candidatus Promineifilaceae bacterium]